MSAPTYVTIEQIEEIMGVGKGSIVPVAWLVLQEESQGVPRSKVAEGLGVAIIDIDSLEQSVTGSAIPEVSRETWMKGVIALRTVAIVNQQAIGTGWDAIEAMAVDKIARNVASMKTPGDLEKMMNLAQIANKAVRRGQGEGKSQGGGLRIGINAGSGGASVELPGGNIGMIRLTLSPAIQAQLQQPNRVIDMVANRDQTATRTANLEMLNLSDTRKVASDAARSVLETGEVNGMVFSMEEDDEFITRSA